MSTSLKILVIARCPPYPLHWGDRLAIYHINREHARMGHIIDYIGMSQLPDDADHLPEYEHIYRHITLIKETPRHPLSYLRRLLLPGARFPTTAEKSWSPEMWHTIEAHLLQHTYDVIHLFGSIHVYEFYHLIADQNAVIMPYESYALYLERTIARQGGLMNRLRHRIVQEYERFMFTPYRLSVVLAEPDRQTLLKLNPALDVRVIPNGINLDYWQARQTRRHPATLLFVGNYEYAPNLDAAYTLIHDILPQVRQTMPHAQLQLVGNAPPPQLQALGDSHIHIIGRVPDVRPYLAEATAFVSPLRIGAGIKNKILEALAMGIPLIGTPISLDGISVTSGEQAIVCDVQAMPDQIIALLNDPAHQEALGRQARQLIETHYSTRQVAQAHLAIYQETRP